MMYVQLILGAMFRHHGMSWWPHVLNAVSGVGGAGVDVHSCLVPVLKDRCCAASGDYHVVIADCAALPRLYRVYYPCGLGT